MYPVTLVNGVKSDYVSVDDRGLNYGDGLFETILVKNNKPVLFDAHWQRLSRSAKVMQINCPAKEIVAGQIAEVIANNQDGVLKIIVTRGQGNGRGYQYSPDHSPTCIVRYFPPSESSKIFANDIRLTFSQYPLAPSIFGGIKHLNRLEQINARAELSKSKYNEIICSDIQGNIIECSSANIFFCTNNIIYTPLINNFGIKGIIRDWVISCAEENHIQINECELTREIVLQSDEVFITNSIIGVRSVAKIEQIIYQSGETTRMLAYLYEEMINE